MKITEQNFIQQLQKRNERALEYVMFRYGGLVKSVARRFLGNMGEDVEECVNDVFLAIWEHSGDFFPERGSFANWIAGIARLKALDRKRKYAARLAEISFEEAERFAGDKLSREIAEIGEEFSRETEEMLSYLKPKDRELFLKLYVEERTVEEVSREMKMKRDMVYNHVSRGKKKLRSLFGSRRERRERL